MDVGPRPRGRLHRAHRVSTMPPRARRRQWRFNPAACTTITRSSHPTTPRTIRVAMRARSRPRSTWNRATSVPTAATQSPGIAKRDADADEPDRVSPALARGGSKPIVARLKIEVAVHVLPRRRRHRPERHVRGDALLHPGCARSRRAETTGCFPGRLPSSWREAADRARRRRGSCGLDAGRTVRSLCGGDDDAGASSPLPPPVDAVGLRTGLREPRPRAPYESIELTLPGPIRPGDTASASLHVGSVKNADGGGSNAEYAFESFAADDVAKGWSVDEPSGSVAAGDRKKVTFTFAYPSTPRPVDPCYFGIPETVRADVTCVLRGGAGAGAGGGGGRRCGWRCGAGCCRREPRRRSRRRRRRRRRGRLPRRREMEAGMGWTPATAAPERVCA